MTPGEGAAKFEHIFPPFGVGVRLHLYLCLGLHTLAEVQPQKGKNEEEKAQKLSVHFS